MDGMDSMNGMGGMNGPSSFTPLTTDGVDFSNRSQALGFLTEVLDDSYFQIDGKAYARYFWYGMLVLIGLASLVYVLDLATQRARYATWTNLV